jgi:hypothetical protein
MKTKLFLLAVFAFTAPLFAADSIKVLLTAKSNAADKTAPRAFNSAIINDTRVTADTITWDSATNMLICTGSVKITVSGAVATCERCKLTLGGMAKIFILDPNGVETRQNAAVTLPELDTSLHR